MEGKLQCHSPLMSVAQALAPCWNQMHNHIFESSQLEGLYIGGVTVPFSTLSSKHRAPSGDPHYLHNKTLINHQGEI